MGPTSFPFVIAYRPFVAGDIPRPLLVMHVLGLNGQRLPALGIVDSGADTTSFPFSYATLLGYSLDDLEEETFVQAGGQGTAYRAKRPCTAIVPEVPDHPVTMSPSFIDGSQTILWGRHDFMTVFDVAISECHQQFAISPNGIEPEGRVEPQETPAGTE